MKVHSRFTSWYVKFSDARLGPFSYFEIIRQLQEKILHTTDLVCLEDSENWTRIAECEHFNVENIRALLQFSTKEVQNIFFKRQPRVKYLSEVVAHINKDSVEGQSLELSANGVGLILNSPKLYLGQNLFLFFKVSDEIPKFNAIGTIVSKTPKANKESIYGIKFVNITKDIKETIKNFTQNERTHKKTA